MKRYLLIACLFTHASGFAQKTPVVSLKKGQEITINTASNMNVDMMIKMANNTTTTYKIKVIGIDDKNYTVTSTALRVVVDGNMMGQAIAFDSDKKEDMDSDQGNELGKMIGKTDTVLIDIKTGIGKDLSPEKALEKESGAGVEGMMTGAMAYSGSATASSIFFIVPGELKEGYSWTDSSTVDGMKTVTVYKVDNIKNGIATITTTGSVVGTTSMEAQGQSMAMKMDTKTTGLIIIDAKTNLVKKRTNIAEIEGSMNAMGQDMAFTSKTTIESEYK